MLRAAFRQIKPGSCQYAEDVATAAAAAKGKAKRLKLGFSR
jgi:hypothetical protein